MRLRFLIKNVDCFVGTFSSRLKTVKIHYHKLVPSGCVWYAGRDETEWDETKRSGTRLPCKFRSMNTFWKYYSGEAMALYPTIFIGGNHEASNYLWELYYGGWAAPNIYFLGFAGVVKFGNLQIGHFERPPYNGHTIRSLYHVCEYDFHKLMQVEEPIDIFLSHDCPVGITDCGDWKELVWEKPDFKVENKGKLVILIFWFRSVLHLPNAKRNNSPVLSCTYQTLCGTTIPSRPDHCSSSSPN
ncbi:lariat debranching enzyme-like [Pyrus ussuriensis x Pyrus communis]|uniref:Lariat debranching enzyme-like n=1 Tax=Pyrus ussuriensis x Pyrus communis TaxID=2448454 RepID=A0A5N5IAX1_9ROSA|nr:lariat debranching enzyme-like [Pyrus ussuriensis x Pyrus communis]